MDQSFVDEMKGKLEEEKQVLNKELKAISDPDVGDHVPGERAAKFPNYGDDAMDADDQSPIEVQDFEVNVSVTGTLESQSHAINAALKRVEDGTFGTCISCKGDISQDRLRANPAADKCINCAKSHTA